MTYHPADTVGCARVVVGSWVPTALADRFADLARRNDRSVSAEVRIALRERLAREEGQTAT